MAEAAAPQRTESNVPSNADGPPGPNTFVCNICLDHASEPVVTMCGHLYCWPCIYKWMCQQESPQCPVCKAAVSKDRLIPIYGRGGSTHDPRLSAAESDAVPDRPAAPRHAGSSASLSPRRDNGRGVPTSPRRDHARSLPGSPGSHHSGAHDASPRHFSLPAAVGDGAPTGPAPTVAPPENVGTWLHIFGSIFGLQLILPQNVVAGVTLSPEQAQEALLARMLLLLGSLVILSLLLF